MLCEIGTRGRIIRVILGLTVIGVGVCFQSWWGAVGVIFLIGAATNRCPLSCLGKKKES